MQKATRRQTKEHNTRLVLKTIYGQGDLSRADVARRTNLTRTTVSDIVGELIENGLLEETGIGETAGGKPPILLNVRNDARQLVCIELGGSNLSQAEFRGAVVNLRGQICQRDSRTLDGRSGEASLAVLYELINALLSAASAPVIGIGLAVPGLTDIEQGIVRNSVSLQWKDLPLKVLLAGRYPLLPIYLLNDGHAAALAEYTFGEMRRSPNLIVVRIGEGIGSGILLSGQIHYGDGYGAGEIGHLTVVEGGRRCSCGNYGCLETVASPRALVQRVQELAEYDWISFALPTPTSGLIDWPFIRDAFASEDETITGLVKEAGRYLGISIANLVTILNVHRIVISGSFVDFGSLFLEAVSSEVKRRSLFTMAADTQVVNSMLGPDNVILGAAAQVLAGEAGLP